MNIKFTKMQGCGNDYIYINGFIEQVPPTMKKELVIRLSDRHFGIGGDGVIFINPSVQADFEMEMYNADGSRSQMCGNGIRCVGKYVYDHFMTERTDVSVVSAGQVKYLVMQTKDGKVSTVRVNMGQPELEAADIPVISSKSPVVEEPIEVLGKEYKMTCVSMGNPHAVVFVNDTKNLPMEEIGPVFECHPAFPQRVNTEFVEIVDKTHIRMRVYERGTGETLACGTGCCASVVACILNGKTSRNVEVEVLGGKILVEWDEQTNEVFMTGPAETVFEGEINV